MKRVILAGNAITAEVLLSYLQKDERYEVAGLTVDDEYLASGSIKNISAVGMSEVEKKFPSNEFKVIMAVGYGNLNNDRESIFIRLKKKGYSIETYVHPRAEVYTAKTLGEGCVVLPTAVVEPHAEVGANTMIWSNVTVAHHSSVAKNCWVAAGTVISGHASILRNSFIGVNATIVNKVTVGEYNIVGAGALITKDTKAKSVYLARSAERFRYSSEDYVKYFGV